MAALKGPAEVGAGRGLVAVGAAVAATVGVGAGGGSVGAGCVGAGADVFVGGTAVGGGCVGGTSVGLTSGAVVGAAGVAEAGAAGCGLPQATNVINNSNVKPSRNLMIRSPYADEEVERRSSWSGTSPKRYALPKKR